MLEMLLHRYADPIRAALATQLAGWGLGGGVLVAMAAAFGMVAAVCVAAHFYLLGLVLFAFNRIAAILAGGRSGVGAISVPDLIIYAALAFAFAIADPPRALAASFLLFGVVVLAGCAVAFDAARLPHREAAALAVEVALFAAVTACCIRPDWFSLIAYIAGLLCFPFAGAYAAASIARQS
jgi:hypothetical protein